MTDERDWPEALDQRIEGVATASDPYDVALEVCGIALDHIAQSVVASRLYRIWGELQDGLEFGLKDEAATFAAMRRAASEWSVAKDDATTRHAYLDHWEYDVCGFERPIDA